MQIVQTVFGVFHHFDLARQLLLRGHLECVFSTWPHARVDREQLPVDKVKTFPWIHTPEYLLRRYGVLPRWLDDEMGYANALAFDEYTSRKLPHCDALIAISGSSLKTGRMLQARGGVMICDRGSSHQRFQEQIITEEYLRWGIMPQRCDPRRTEREEAIYDQADAIVVASSFASRSFIEMNIPPQRVYTIPLGVELGSFSPVSAPPADCFEVLFVGGVSLRKGIPYLLQAFSGLRCARKRLRIVGAMGREIAAILSRLPMADVEIVGALPRHSLPHIMGSSHVLVLPSIEDGFGMVIGQALASGCPVIATENTGAPDIIKDSVEGFIVPIRDSKALCDCMQKLADDPSLQLKMRNAGLLRVAEIGGWNKYGESWERLLLYLTAAR